MWITHLLCITNGSTIIVLQSKLQSKYINIWMSHTKHIKTSNTMTWWRNNYQNATTVTNQNSMEVINTATERDVSGLYLKLMKKEITNAEFEELAEIPEEDRKLKN